MNARVRRCLLAFSMLVILAGCRERVEVSPGESVATSTGLSRPEATVAAPTADVRPTLIPSQTAGAGPAASGQASPADAGLPSPTIESSPFPYTTPLPPPVRTALDGRYVKLDPIPGTPTPCRRCPDWKPEGGEWLLRFDQGVFRISHAVTGWRTVGSFTVSGDRLVLFNDPTCHREIGTYTWKLERGALTLEVVEDTCAIGLRAKNLTAMPWNACQPPNTEAAVTDHWPRPAGC